MELYVTTGEDGVDRSLERPQHWNLPMTRDGVVTEAKPTEANGNPLVLRNVDDLLDVLDEQIFLARPEDETDPVGSPLAVGRAVLVSPTAWDLERAARFALDCAEHALGDASTVPLPHGKTLADVLGDARSFLEQSAPDAEDRLSLLSRLTAAWRLRRQAGRLGDMASELLREDLAHELDAVDDPAWATLAALEDGVLAVVDALRHLALGRYLGSRDDLPPTWAAAPPGVGGQVLTTPWGPVLLGGEYRASYLPAGVAAREAAVRAREAIADRAGEHAAADERRWQVELLASLL